MFFLIPLLIILVSLIGIAFIVYRKVPYLRKLSPDAHEEDFVYDFFPEAIDRIRAIRWHEYRQSFLKEIEKLLRRLRVASMKIDHASHALITRIRKSHASSTLKQELSKQDEAVNQIHTPLVQPSPAEEARTKEQALIIEIAKNPKNPRLYEALGDLYLLMHNRGEAKESYEAALALEPHNTQLAQKYSQLLKDSQQAS